MQKDSIDGARVYVYINVFSVQVCVQYVYVCDSPANKHDNDQKDNMLVEDSKFVLCVQIVLGENKNHIAIVGGQRSSEVNIWCILLCEHDNAKVMFG